MNWIVVHTKPYEGRYPFDLSDDFTIREWGWIKKLTGYMPLTADEGFRGGDPELYAALAVLMLVRAGKVNPDDIQDVFVRLTVASLSAALTIEFDQAEDGDQVDPPASSPGNDSSSGTGSTTSSETSPANPNGSGTPASVSSGSARETWGT